MVPKKEGQDLGQEAGKDTHTGSGNILGLGGAAKDRKFDPWANYAERHS